MIPERMRPSPERASFGPERFLEPDPVIEALRAEVDLTLLHANLARTPEERVLRMMDMMRLVEALRAGPLR
jgi:hypothetical protein